MVKVTEFFAQRLIRWFTGSPLSEATTILLSSEDVRSLELPSPMSKRYQIIKVLGKGAFGIVYLARDQRIGRLLAMKQLYGKYSESAEIHQRFLQEARIAGQVDNPNIVTIFDVRDEEGIPCILMEYLGGGNLNTTLKLDAPLNELTALGLMRGIMNGLNAAHRMSVIHRDIKPQNILFDQHGTPKISDFGVAHLPVEAGGINDEFSTSQVAGTPYYMAPEQMNPKIGPVDGRVDLYAAGLLFYEMLTGERYHNFSGAHTLRELSREVEKAGAPGQMDFPEGISLDVKKMITRLLETDPADRYPHAQAVLRELDEMIETAEAIGELAETEEKDESRREMFEDIMRLFLVDGVISAPERRELNKRAKRLGITQAVAANAEETVRHELSLPRLENLQAYERRVEQLLVDRDYSEGDHSTLRKIGRRYGISIEEQKKIEHNVMIRFKMKEGVAEDLIP